MAIYRGAGGPGDATTDAANEASIASNKATEAAASAAAAAASASTASTAATSATNSATAAASSASAAASSASSASSSASSASSSATSASSSEANAASSATDAETAQTAAETAQGLAEDAQAAAEAAQAAAEDAQTGAETAETGAIAAKDAALAALADFDDRYFGAFVDDAAVASYASSEGFTIDAGDLYFNTTDTAMQVYDGTQWLAAYVSGSGVLLIANNLSDLANVSDARTNLGLGTAATTASTDYATAAQGALADSATQPGDNVSDLTNDAGYLTFVDNSNIDSTAVTAGYVLSANGTGGTVWAAETDPVYVASSWYTTTNNATNWDTAYGWGNHASAGYLTSYTETDPVFVASPAYGITGTKISNWDDSYTFVAAFPTQTGQSGKFLTTDGSSLSFAAVDALPDQTGNSGKFLTTDGTDASWAAIETGNVTTAGIWEHSATISANYTISSGNNAMSAGPITVASGVTVTVPSGSTWVII